MIIQEALEKGIKLLTGSNIGQPQFEAQIILAHLLKKDRLYLHIHAEEKITNELYRTYFICIEKRCRRMPVAYIVKEKEFMSLSFYVDEHVLIPRPDTELIVEEALHIAKNIKGQIHVLDLCCGSGCIGLAFAHYNTDAHVLLTDISKDALNAADKNVKALQTEDRVEIIQSDLFGNIPQVKFDIILSNPPYISDDDLKQLDADVKDYEPVSALSGGADGMDFYREIIPRARDFLKTEGFLLLETGYDQGEKVKNLMFINDYKEVHVLKDYAGHDRVVKGKNI